MRKLSKRLSAAVAPVMDTLEGRRHFTITPFGVVTSSTTYTVANGAGMTFTILKNGASTSSTIHLGDMTSIKVGQTSSPSGNGTEMLATYGVTSRYSHYEQGLTSTAVISATQEPGANPQWVKITCDDSAAGSGAVIQYYVMKRNDPNIYMASLPIDVTNGPGEGRYIAYMSRSVFTNPELPSDNAPHSATDVVSTIEGGDVFGHTDGAATVQTTSSKFFNMGRRMIENTIHGVTGTGVGAFMTMGNREHSAGGPFFKDIDFQSGSAIEMYNCVFTGHTQTESYRQGLQGPYAMMFTTGATPALPNYSFLEGVGIQGLIPASQRGSTSGVATGLVAGHETVVGLSNPTAQYWGYANATTGAFNISGVQPGTYTETLYDNELEVGTRTVTVNAGVNTVANIANTFYTPAAPIFRIGAWDGTPLGFLNVDKIETEHPQDVRMTDWASTPNFVVGTNTDSQWPLAQFMGVNNSQRITFNLTAAQVQNLTMRIGITWGFSGARPKITVNSGQTYAWTSANPSASSDLNSRGITRGTWRGDNQLYTFGIPSSAFRAGVNTIDVPLISGSYTAGQTWLSPNVAYDALDLVPTTTASAPAIASVTLTPVSSTIGVNGGRAFTAVAKDASGNVITANLDWTAARGTIDAFGNYIAPATAGQDTITVTANTTKEAGYSTSSSSTSSFPGILTGTASTTFSVLTATPAIVNAAAASPNPTGNRKTTLSVLGADLTGEANLTYTWSVVGAAPGSVTFSANGTNAAKASLATFGALGTYTLRATITNTNGLSITSDVTVNVLEKTAWYRVNTASGTTLTDSSGANNTATLNGVYSYVSGIEGNALNLAGGYTKLPNGIVAGLDDFTVGTWVKPDSLGTFARIFDFGSSTNTYMFLTPAVSAGGGMRYAIKTNSASAEQAINGPALAVGVWTHIAVTLVGNVGTLYVNGVAVATNNAMTAHPTALGTTTNNLIGDSQFSADPALLASVDDFRIYGSGLSAADVNAWYKSGSAPTLSSVAVDNGTAQRSMVRSLTVNFSQPVTLAAGAFALTRRAAGANPAADVPFTLTSQAGGASYLLTFTDPTLLGGSLSDGDYDLVVTGANVTNPVDLAVAANTTFSFHRFYGDTNGDRSVSITDFNGLAAAFGTSTGNAAFNSAFDYDSDGTISITDFNAFASRFGVTI